MTGHTVEFAGNTPGMDLLALSDFNLVATHGGVGAASRATRRSKATLSRHVLALEKAMGVRLVERGARSMRLTDAGRSLHERTSALLREVALAADAVSDGNSEPRGVLRISAPPMFSHVLLGQIAAEFVAAYPEVLIEVAVENRLADLVAEGLDLVIRANPKPTDGLVGRCFLRDTMLIVAPPGLPRPDPQRAAMSVPAVVLTDAPAGAGWRCLMNDVPVALVPQPVLRLGSMLMVRDAACAGAGAALLPRSVVAAELAAGTLVCWGIASEPDVELWALHTSRRLVSSKVKAFVAFLVERLS